MSTNQRLSVLALGVSVLAVCATIWAAGQPKRDADKAAKPSLYVAGEVDTYADRAVIPLATRSSGPVVVNGVWWRICPDPVCCAVIEEEGRIQIDTTDVPENKWNQLNIANFQVLPGKVMGVPIQAFDAKRDELYLDVVISYGSNPPKHVWAHHVRVKAIR